MSQFVSFYPSEEINDEIINSLIDNEMIKTKNVEKALRSVDRINYFNIKGGESTETSEYLKLIIMEKLIDETDVLESLQLHSGHSFLNIGSGMGYFNTVAGILLGRNGVNHGIEVDKKLIDLAREKLADFILNSAAIDHHDFCEPIFIQGNACELMPTGYYDRAYCGAAVPPDKLEFMRSLIKIGGILVMPFNGYVVKVTRQDEHCYITEKLHIILRSRLTKLRAPEPCSLEIVTFPPVEPLRLIELCRSNLCSFIRQHLKNENSELKMYTKCVSLNSNTCEQIEDKEEQVNLRDIPNSTFDESVNPFRFSTIFDQIQQRLSLISALRLPSILFNGDVIWEATDGYGENGYDSVAATSSLTQNRFIRDCKLNKLSKRLKEEIYLLPIPRRIKQFLNYNRFD